MIGFLSGAIMMACATCGLVFLKSWRTTGDRLFMLFALAFWALAVERLVLAFFISPEHEVRFYVYTFRMLAFVMIAAAIIDKNRKSGR